MRERDPSQQVVDSAVLKQAEELHERHQQDVAVLFNNAIVKAFSAKG
jgi:hypothetical protein